MTGTYFFFNKLPRQKITTASTEGIREQLRDSSWDKNDPGVGRNPEQSIGPWTEGNETTGCQHRASQEMVLPHHRFFSLSGSRKEKKRPLQGSASTQNLAAAEGEQSLP